MDVELTPKETRSPCADENRSTKKVKIRELQVPSDVCMKEPDGFDRLPNEGGEHPIVVDSGASEASHIDEAGGVHNHSTAPISFRDKLVGKTEAYKGSSISLPEDLTIENGDVQVNMEGLVPSITFSRRIQELMSQCMKYALVVKLLGRFIRQDVLHSKIRALWKPTGNFKITELEGGCFMVKLENAEDYQTAMLGGPWVVLGHYLTIHPWEPSISPSNLEIKQVYGWVRLPGLPYHYYHKNVLRAIGEVIGPVLKIDYNTEGFDKAIFARLAVKLDLTKPLISMIKLDGLTQFIEYEGFPTICYSCGCYGHLEEACPLKNRHSSPSNGQAPSQVNI